MSVLGPDGAFPLADEQVNHYGTVQTYKCWQKGPNSLASLTLKELYESTGDKLDQIFLVYDDERYTFGDIMMQVSALAREMRATYGIGKGDVVGVTGRNSPEWLIAFMASSGYVGATTLPMNSQWKGDEMGYGLEDSGAKLIFADEERAAMAIPYMPKYNFKMIGMRCQPAGCALFSDVVAAGQKRSALPPLPIGQDDPAVLMYTSGTTSNPKGVLSTHRNVMAAVNVMSAMAAQGAAGRAAAVKPGAPIPSTPQGAILCGVPLFHVTGLHSIFLGSFYAGRKVVLMTKWDATKALQLIERERATVFTGVPTMSYEMISHPDFDKYDTSSLGSIGGGGAAFKPSFANEVKGKFKKGRATQGWGMTETNAVSTLNSGDGYLKRPDSAGRAVMNVEVCAIDTNDLRRLGTDEVGELCIRGATVMQEYFKKPDKTAEAFHIDKEGKLWMRTGDVGRVDGEGFVFIMDRLKDMIIRGGENISCAEVEGVLYQNPAIREAAVFGLPDDRLGEVVGAAVTFKEDAGAKPSVEELTKLCQANLAKFKVPEKIVLWAEPELPKGATGKIVKKDIKDIVVKSMASKL